MVLTDVEGLYRDWPNSSEVITELSATELRQLMPNLEAGMVPKMEACLRAVEGGLTRATVVDGRVPHALLLEIFTNVGIGTMVTQDGLIRLGSRVFSRDQGIPPHEYGNGEFGAVSTTRGATPLNPRRARKSTRERGSKGGDPLEPPARAQEHMGARGSKGGDPLEPPQGVRS